MCYAWYSVYLLYGKEHCFDKIKHGNPLSPRFKTLKASGAVHKYSSDFDKVIKKVSTFCARAERSVSPDFGMIDFDR